MVDFLILYEHKARELENSVLLSLYLEKKGYSVKLLQIDSFKNLFVRARVVLAPYAYDNDNVFSFTYFPLCKVKKLINLQYEQIFVEKDEEKKVFYPKDIAQKCQIIAWGNHAYNSLQVCGVKKSNIRMVGHIGMDLDSDRFKCVFGSKKQLSQKLNIPTGKHWHMFISSFIGGNLFQAQIDEVKKVLDDYDERLNTDAVSQSLIVDWFERFLSTHPDTVIIYRPHPNEIITDAIVKLNESHSNFTICSDYSIRQWIRVADSISTWYSTSVADVYFAHKACAILRPYPIPNEYEIQILKDAHLIKTYDDYLDFMDSGSKSFPICEDIVKGFYINSFNGDCHKRLGNVCIEILHDKKSAYNYQKALDYPVYRKIKRVVWFMMMIVGNRVNLSHVLPSKFKAQAYYAYKENQNVGKEIALYRRRLGRVLNEEQ